MKATITATGDLIVYPETELDAFALDHWININAENYYNTDIPMAVYANVNSIAGVDELRFTS